MESGYILQYYPFVNGFVGVGLAKPLICSIKWEKGNEIGLYFTVLPICEWFGSEV
jgi:hypothetical protein